MLISRGTLLRQIEDQLAILTTKVTLSNSQGRTDINCFAEDFYCGLLNIVLSAKLTNANSLKLNFPSIDLVDEEQQLCVQITSVNDRKKLDQTLNTFFQHQLDKVYKRLIVLIIGEKRNYRKAFPLSRNFAFDPRLDIWDTPMLYGKIACLDNDKLESIVQYLQQHLTSYATLTVPYSQAVAGDNAYTHSPAHTNINISAAFEKYDIHYLHHPELRSNFFDMDGTSLLRIPFAVDENNNIQILELGGNTSCHALILGSSGSGKSVLLHTLLLQTVQHYHPDDVEVWAFDYKQIEFKQYSNFRPPHFRSIVPSIEKHNALIQLIDALYSKYELRIETFRRNSVTNIIQYRKCSAQHRMSRVLILIDDCDLLFHHPMYEVNRIYIDKFLHLLRVSRTFGFSFIFSCQTPALLELDPNIARQIGTHLYLPGNPAYVDTLCQRYGIPFDVHSIYSRLCRGRCFYRQSFWDINEFDGHETSSFTYANIISIDQASSREIIRTAQSIVGRNYAPKNDITL